MFLQSLNISASGMTMQQYRLNLISQNITNAETTRTADGTPYKRKIPVVQEIADVAESNSFRWHLHRSLEPDKNTSTTAAYGYESQKGGVKVVEIMEDPTPNKIVYDPTHPDADEKGYVNMPNVELVREMVDMMGASRSYEANIQALNAIKAMAQKALEIR